MQHNKTNDLRLIYQLLEKLYTLNSRGYFTAWFDWSGHTNGIYIKIIKGKWEKDKKEKIIYEALVCTRFNKWKNGLSYERFDISDFFTLVQSLIEYNPSTKAEYKKIPA